MAKTLIGQLILRLRTEGLGEAKKVTDTMRDVENAARRLGQTGSGTWGAGFQRQLNSLKLTATEIREVESSWMRLHEAMRGRNLAGALRGMEIGHWKTNTISALAAQRAAIENHFKTVESNARQHGIRMRDILRAGYVSLGFYTGAQAGGTVTRVGFKEASERSRVDAESYYRGLSDSERGSIETAAADLATRRRVSQTDVMEILADAAMNMKNTDAALKTGDSQVAAYKVWANTYGEEAAISYLRAFNRAMDNTNVDDPNEYKGMLDNFMKAWQVSGKDIDPAAWAQGIKYARGSGKVFDRDFLSRVLPFVMAETSGTDAGTQLRAIFDQFIVGRASKESIAAQSEYGLRDGVKRDAKGRVIEKGTLTQADLFAKNPLDWFNRVLLPAMEAKGVNTGDPVVLAEEIGKLTNNRLSSDAAIKAILGFEQMQRILNERFPNAKGLAAADTMDEKSLGSATDGLVTAYGNLAAALAPVESVINPGLNALADGINRLAAAAKDNPILVSLGLLSAGAGALKGGQFALGKMTDMFGLKGSAIALDGSAAALTRAAVALGGAGVADGLGGASDGKGKPSSKVGRAAKYGALAAGPGTMLYAVDQMLFGGAGSKKLDENVSYASAFLKALGTLWNQKARGEEAPAGDENLAAPGWFKRFMLGKAAEENFNFGDHMGIPLRGGDPQVDTGGLDEAQQKAMQTGQGILDALSVTARPVVDLGPLQEANRLVQAIRAGLDGIGAAATRAQNNAGAEMRRNFSDRGGGF